jgi:hypothetical protein
MGKEGQCTWELDLEDFLDDSLETRGKHEERDVFVPDNLNNILQSLSEPNVCFIHLHTYT